MTNPSDRLGLTAMRMVQAPRALRLLAYVLLVLFVGVPPSLFLVPWQQNVQATGKVTALDPIDRIQLIRAPVSGRLVELSVQEGALVHEGDELASMSDLDTGYFNRLGEQLDYARDKVRAEEDLLAIIDQQVDIAQSAKEQAVEIARRELLAVRNRVEIAEQELLGARARFEQKQLDFDRKVRLKVRGTVSENDVQEAERDFKTAEAAVNAAVSSLEQATNAEAGAEVRVENVANAEQAKVEEIRSKREMARSDLNLARQQLNEAITSVERQTTRVVTAPRRGYVQRVYAAATAELISQGSPLIEIVPDTPKLAVELWVRGIDAPLISPGRKVRLQFEGWPAVQFVSWPSVAVGTYGGVVSFIDAHGDGEGRFRVLVSPDPEDRSWPDRARLRQGVRANGWLLLDTVSLGFEIWRNLNSFPLSLRHGPVDESGAGTATPAGGDKGRSAPSGGGAVSP